MYHGPWAIVSLRFSDSAFNLRDVGRTQNQKPYNAIDDDSRSIVYNGRTLKTTGFRNCRLNLQK